MELKNKFLTSNLPQQIIFGVVGIANIICFLMFGLLTLYIFLLINFNYIATIADLDLKDNDAAFNLIRLADIELNTNLENARNGIQWLRNFYDNYEKFRFNNKSYNNNTKYIKNCVSSEFASINYVNNISTLECDKIKASAVLMQSLNNIKITSDYNTNLFKNIYLFSGTFPSVYAIPYNTTLAQDLKSFYSYSNYIIDKAMPLYKNYIESNNNYNLNPDSALYTQDYNNGNKFYGLNIENLAKINPISYDVFNDKGNYSTSAVSSIDLYFNSTFNYQTDNITRLITGIFNENFFNILSEQQRWKYNSLRSLYAIKNQTDTNFTELLVTIEDCLFFKIVNNFTNIDQAMSPMTILDCFEDPRTKLILYNYFIDIPENIYYNLVRKVRIPLVDSNQIDGFNLNSSGKNYKIFKNHIPNMSSIPLLNSNFVIAKEYLIYIFKISNDYDLDVTLLYYKFFALMVYVLIINCFIWGFLIIYIFISAFGEVKRLVQPIKYLKTLLTYMGNPTIKKESDPLLASIVFKNDSSINEFFNVCKNMYKEGQFSKELRTEKESDLEEMEKDMFLIKSNNWIVKEEEIKKKFSTDGENIFNFKDSNIILIDDMNSNKTSNCSDFSSEVYNNHSELSGFKKHDNIFSENELKNQDETKNIFNGPLYDEVRHEDMYLLSLARQYSKECKNSNPLFDHYKLLDLSTG